MTFALPSPSTATGPQLFFGADDLPRLRRLYAKDPRFAEMREGLERFDRTAEWEFLRSKVNLEDHRNDIRQCCDTAQNMAFHHLMSGNEDAADLAIAAVRTLMKFADWDFFTEAGTKIVGVQAAPRAAIAVAAVVDWLGDRIETAEKQAWLQTLGERGCEPCYTGLHNIRYPRQCQGWGFNPRSVMYAERATFPNDNARRPEITQTTNLRAAPASGLAIGATAIGLYGGDRDSLDRWLEMAINAFQVFEHVYLPDGSYGEGVNYGNYTSESIFMALVALQRAGVADLRGGINWCGHLRFMLNMAMPTAENPYEVVNIGDSGRHRGKVHFQHPDGRAESRSALAFWVAREFRDGAAQWFGENLAAAHNLWSLIFFDETVTAESPVDAPQTWFSDLDWVVARTGYRAGDLLVSLRSGIGWNHEHADRNSIIIKAHGEQMIVDPSRPPYNFTDPSWIMRTTAGHSAVLVNGAGHFYHNGIEGTNSTIAQARLRGRGEGAGWSWWVSDATQAYRLADREIRQVVRGIVVLFELQTVVVIDRLAMWHAPAIFEARFFADNWDGAAKIDTTSDGFLIKRPGATAVAKVLARDPVTIGTGWLPIPEERAAQHPFISVETAPTMATTLVTAIALSSAGGEPAECKFVSTGDGITVKVKTGGNAATCRIGDADLGPTIAVERRP